MGQFGTGQFNLGSNLFDSTVDVLDYMREVDIERRKRSAQEATKASDTQRAIANEVEVRKYNSPANQVKMLKEAGINPWNKVGFIAGDKAELMTGMYEMNAADLQTETLKREPITLEQVAQAQGIETAELNNDYLRLKNYGQVLQNDKTLAETSQIRQNTEFMNSPWFLKFAMKILGIEPSKVKAEIKSNSKKSTKNEKVKKKENNIKEVTDDEWIKYWEGKK